MLQMFAVLCILIGFSLGSAAAQAKEIRFVAKTITGKPIKGQILMRLGSAPPAVLANVDDSGIKTVTDIQCKTGLQFRFEVKESSLYFGSNAWKDCTYGDIRFLLNEVVWSAEFKAAIEKLYRLTLEGSADMQFAAIVATSAYEKGDFGILAFAAAQLKQKTINDPTAVKAFTLLEKDSIARSLGMVNGIQIMANGEVDFTKQAKNNFKNLKTIYKLPFDSLNDPKINAYIANNDFKNLK